MQIVNSVEEEIWRDFLKANPQSNIFHTPEMFEVFNQAQGYKPDSWFILNRSNNLLAIFLPVYVTLFDGLLKRFTTRAVSFGSILYEPGSEGENAIKFLLEKYCKKINGQILFTELRNLSDQNEIQGILNDCGYYYEDHLNYLINLNCSAEDLLKSFGKRTRKRIRRALKQQKVIVKDLENFDELELSYKLINKSYSSANVPLADFSLFKAAFDILSPKGMVKFLVSWVDDTAVAASAELIYKDTIYGWYGGVDRGFSEFVPNELLMWHILKWGAENGFRLYDFGGAGKPDEEYGVRDFKAKFGGELVCYGRNTLIHAPIRLAVSKFGYEIYRRLRV